MIEPPPFYSNFTAALKADPSNDNTPRQVADAAYSLVEPTPVSKPKLIAYSAEIAELLGLEDEVLNSSAFIEAMSGNALLPGMMPFSMNYGGHQFGQWAGQLGDGRAINLGELRDAESNPWMIQLKGAGPTPYSRTADGRAVLRSSIREFLCSEAMFHLGIPTTRALTLVTTGDGVERDMFYNGNAAFEPGAIVSRVSQSFVRFGSFQIHAARGETELLRQLVDFVITSQFPHLGVPSPEVYLQWLNEICRDTASLVCHWMRVGFVHGVLNTDNMSIMSQTIDYGPYGWIDDYNPDWTPNTTDAQSRRYVFGNQARVAHWNLAQLARAIFPLIGSAEPLQEILDAFPAYYQDQYRNMMLEKLGLSPSKESDDDAVIADVFGLFGKVETDMTIFFRQLASIDSLSTDASISHLENAWYSQPEHDNVTLIQNWIELFAKRVQQESGFSQDRIQRMNLTNPKFILRNYLAQQAIDLAHQEDYSMIHELLTVMNKPYAEQPEYEQYFARRPDWARNKPGSSMLSCSS